MPLPKSSAARIRSTRSEGIGSPDALRAKVCRMSASQAHSSSIWLGASTKSHSVATPENRVKGA